MVSNSKLGGSQVDGFFIKEFAEVRSRTCYHVPQICIYVRRFNACHGFFLDSSISEAQQAAFIVFRVDLQVSLTVKSRNYGETRKSGDKFSELHHRTQGISTIMCAS